MTKSKKSTKPKVAKSKKMTIKNYTLEDTSDKNIKRLVDVNGDWTHYKLVKQKKLVPAVNYILSLGYNKGPRFAQYLLSVSKEEAKAKLENAGDEGSRFHRAVSDILAGITISLETKYPSDVQAGRQEKLSMTEWNYLLAWDAWCEKYNPRTVEFERAVASEKWGYAGTFDWVGIITVPDKDKAFDKEFWGKDVLMLPLDWKSSSGIWDEYPAQVAAYADAIRESKLFEEYIKEYKGRIFTGVVRVGTRHKNGGFEMKVWNEDETVLNFIKFLAAQEIAKINTEFTDEIQEIPAEIDRVVPKATKPVKEKRAKKPVRKTLKSKSEKNESDKKTTGSD